MSDFEAFQPLIFMVGGLGIAATFGILFVRVRHPVLCVFAVAGLVASVVGRFSR